MQHFLFAITSAALLVMTGGSANARLIDTKNICSPSFAFEDFRPIVTGIVGPAGADVCYDKDSCRLVGSRCRNERLPAGGDVLLGRHWRGFVCAYLPDRRYSIGGWVKADKVIPRPFDHNPPLRAWLGHWTGDDDPDPPDDPNVHFLLRRGALVVEGESWMFPPDDHIATLNEIVTRKGYMAYDAPCRAKFWLIGKFLIAKDHVNPCGSGSGFYGVSIKVSKRRSSL